MIRLANDQGLWRDSSDVPIEQVTRSPIDYYLAPRADLQRKTLSAALLRKEIEID